MQITIAPHAERRLRSWFLMHAQRHVSLEVLIAQAEVEAENKKDSFPLRLDPDQTKTGRLESFYFYFNDFDRRYSLRQAVAELIAVVALASFVCGFFYNL